jgi:hypothetical protein
VDAYRLVDDPATGQRWLVLPGGEWAEIDAAALNELAASGRLATLPAETQVMAAWLAG